MSQGGLLTWSEVKSHKLVRAARISSLKAEFGLFQPARTVASSARAGRRLRILMISSEVMSAMSHASCQVTLVANLEVVSTRGGHSARASDSFSRDSKSLKSVDFTDNSGSWSYPCWDDTWKCADGENNWLTGHLGSVAAAKKPLPFSLRRWWCCWSSAHINWAATTLLEIIRGVLTPSLCSHLFFCTFQVVNLYVFDYMSS